MDNIRKLQKTKRRSPTCIEELSEPRRIQVLWELPRGRKVWWDADVSDFQPSSSGKLEGAEATIRYRAAHGHPSSLSQVKFINQVYLQHANDHDALRLSWRTRIDKQRQKHQRSRRDRTAGLLNTELEKEMKLLRGRVADTTDKITALQKQMELTATIWDTSQKSRARKEQSVRDVMAFLRQRLALQLQRPPRTKSRVHDVDTVEEICRPGRGGITRACIKANADCDLEVFELIARSIRTDRSGHAKPSLFSPSYEMTQMPREGSTYFKIMFPSFSHLCNAIGLSSASDRFEMLRKYGMSRGEGVMRLLGTYEFDEGDIQQPTYIHVGRSRAHGSTDVVDEREPNGKEHGLVQHVLMRATRAWNVEDRRYETPLRLQCYSASSMQRQPCYELEDLNTSWFHLIWKKAPEVRHRNWSSSITQSDVIVGKLEVVFPCVIISGSMLCDEFTSLLTNTVLQSVVA